MKWNDGTLRTQFSPPREPLVDGPRVVFVHAKPVMGREFWELCAADEFRAAKSGLLVPVRTGPDWTEG